MRTLACLLGRLFTRAANLLDGIVGSSRRRHFLRSVEVKSAFISALSFALKACINAALLYGNTIFALLWVSSVGSWSTVLESPSTAFLASLSTDSLPAMFVWPGTQRMLRQSRLCFFMVLSRKTRNMSVKESPCSQTRSLPVEIGLLFFNVCESAVILSPFECLFVFSVFLCTHANYTFASFFIIFLCLSEIHPILPSS